MCQAFVVLGAGAGDLVAGGVLRRLAEPGVVLRFGNGLLGVDQRNIAGFGLEQRRHVDLGIHQERAIDSRHIARAAR